MHVLKIGTTGDYAPFSFYKKKKLVGVDIDLAIHFAKFANKKIKFIKTSWPALTSDVKDNKFDLALSGICPTNDRKKIGLVSNNICTSYKTLFINKK
jgi:cyclohexadienyl dehydratase